MRFNEKTKKLTRLVYSIVALTMLLTLLVTASYAWMSSQLTSSVASDEYITIDAEAGLQMNYGDEDQNQSSININNVVGSDFKLTEASSYDGRTIYFPISEYSHKNDADGDFTSTKTEDFIYREATVIDKNKKYISIDLTLTSQTATNVCLSSDSKISGKAANAVRVSFIENIPGGKATVFDNSEDDNFANQENQNYTVQSVSKDGNVSASARSDLHSFNNYIFGNAQGNVLFTLDANVPLSVTVNIWLEGTDTDCTNQILNLSDLDIYIKFSTSVEEMQPVYFVDHTLEKWVDDDDCYVYIISDNGKMHQMRKSDNYETDYTWVAEVPKNFKISQFTRYNPVLQENKPQEWNYWDAGSQGTTTTYNAVGHSAGIWRDNLTTTTVTFYDCLPDKPLIDQNETTMLYIKYDVEDGNGNVQTLHYKMSFQWQRARWCINIPSDVSTISYYWYYAENGEAFFDDCYLYWEDTERGNNIYFSANDYGTGYWSSKLMYIDGAAYHNNCIFVAYFYNDSTGDIYWTGMHATTEKGRYIAVVPDNIEGVVFCRYEEGLNYYDWGASVYNQTTQALEKFGNNNMLKLSGYTSDNKLTGNWYNTTEP